MLEVAFPLAGSTLPTDHGYALFGACSRVLGPSLHAARWLALGPVRGERAGRLLRLTEASALRLRCPAERLPDVLPLAGRVLELDGHRVTVGTPTVAALAPAPRLRARLVTIKGFLEPEPFLEAVRRQLGVAPAKVVLGPRRVVRVARDTVVGYGLELCGLAPDDSRHLLAEGIGGRRRFGCGFFFPLAKSTEVE